MGSFQRWKFSKHFHPISTVYHKHHLPLTPLWTSSFPEPGCQILSQSQKHGRPPRHLFDFLLGSAGAQLDRKCTAGRPVLPPDLFWAAQFHEGNPRVFLQPDGNGQEETGTPPHHISLITASVQKKKPKNTLEILQAVPKVTVLYHFIFFLFWFVSFGQMWGHQYLTTETCHFC